MKKRLPSFRKLLLFYLLTVAASFIYKQFRTATPPLGEGQTRAGIAGVDFAYKDIPADAPDAPVIVLIHGSPMSSSSWNALLDEIRGDYRIIVPDLPGFGGSTRKIDDYSIAAHADYLDHLLEYLDVPSAHILGYSMGGGVALELYDQSPQRVTSLTLLSAIGVQELELLGDYTLNHAIHGAQLGFFWLVEHLTPNFGLLDDSPLNLSYCRNFYDTDQRPLRDILLSVEVPTLILHGEKDPLVPIAAAKEHARLVPQSQAKFYPEHGHMFLFTDPNLIVESMAPFISQAESGDGITRDEARQVHIDDSTRDFDYTLYENDMRGRVILLIILLAIATLVSEDITCITAGLLVSQGALGFVPATLGCFIGIVVGDTGLYLIGRILGVRVLKIPPLKWMVDADKIERSKKFFDRHGSVLILVSRWLPGMRVPTYVAGGMLKHNFFKFITFFGIAAAIWTPILVGLSTVMGDRLLGWLHRYEGHAFLVLVLTIVIVLFTVNLVMALATHRGRRLLVGKWRRRLRWEFWPSFVIYTPVVFYIIWLMVRYRGVTLPTAANPGIPHGGIALESKSQILGKLGSQNVARFDLIPSETKDKLALFEDFLAQHEISYPVVLKPDTGERGQGVAIIRNTATAKEYLAECPDDVIVQEFVPGEELGVLYIRHPDEENGRITSVTEKKPTTVTGDGGRTLEFLILDDSRAVCSAKFFLKKHADRLDEVPAAGDVVALSELGTHARGSLFLDGEHLNTDALAEIIDLLSEDFAGFHIGRYDLRYDGANLKVIELNGITSEPTHIYDPKHGLFYAVRTLCGHWRSTFEIGAKNRKNGTRPSSLISVFKLFFQLANRQKWEAP